MSFMFNPYPYVDPDAINYPEFTAETTKSALRGNIKIGALLAKTAGILALDGYVGASYPELLVRIEEANNDVKFFDVAEAYKTSEELDDLLAESLPTDRVIDPILLFGKSVHRELDSLFDSAKLAALTDKLQAATKENSLVVVYGCGAACTAIRKIAAKTAFIDVTPMAVTVRIRAGKVTPLGDKTKRTLSYIFRRLYYYDYEIMMLHRKQLMDNNALDYYIDGNCIDDLRLISFEDLEKVFAEMLQRPFRCTPVYIEGVWGGQFVKKLRKLPEDMRNCAWVFDMIPNEVSLQVKAGPCTFNIPFSAFFRHCGEKLMGKESVERFGCVFPIRFNYDDTYGGSGNMSIQVHPPCKYNQDNFGEPFQQDESYYCVKTAGSKTYLGLTDDCNVEEFYKCIDKAEKEYVAFDHDKYVNSFPSEEGDQFLLPGGTIHASGRNQVVLEIGSYTIGSYTFKLYDYLRSDLDGKPRPIHSIHGKNVLVTDRRRSAVDGVLRPRPVTVREGEGWKEEIVGEHDLIYFSLRRFSFDRSVSDSTEGKKFHVLVLVQGDEILVYSKKDPTRSYHAKYMDMVVLPADLGEYGIINLGKTPCKVTKTMLK